MQDRRYFLKSITAGGAAAMLGGQTYSIASNHASHAKKIRFGVITDLHHLQFGKPEQARLKGFMDAVLRENPDFILQCGDFCRHENSGNIMAEWNRFDGPKYHVLGNHDMDYCDKKTIMEFWKMPDRYYSFDQHGFHFVVLDRNFLKRDDGSLENYNTSNWGKLPASQRSFTDEAQLAWLKNDLAKSKYPAIVFMHQPVFLSDFFQEIGNADQILEIFDEANLNAVKNKSNNKVVAAFMGHDHDDRYGQRNGVHYFIVNSASYVYTQGGAYYYKDPLYAFVTLDPAGTLTIDGTSTIYRDTTPDRVRARFAAKISNHQIGF